MAEQPEIPAVCDRCLGSNPYIEMIRDRGGGECKFCTRPYTTFEWRTKTDTSSKSRQKTIICLTCARSKNCCQVCLLDLTYGLDIALRDSVLKLAGEEPLESVTDPMAKLNTITKQYKAEQADLRFEDQEFDSTTSERAKDVLTKVALATRTPTAAQSAANTKTGRKEISKADLQKIISKLPFNGNLIENEKQLNSFFLFGITDSVPLYAIQNYFETISQTKLKAISAVHKSRCGFISFKNAAVATKTAQQIVSKESLPADYKRPAQILIDNVPIRVCLGKVRPLGVSNEETHKISAVVKKQLQVLADKDAADSK